MSDDTGAKLDIDWLKTIAGALAAVSSAVLLSTLGEAGTIIGAALGSVIATVGGALYTQGLARSREHLAQAQTAALRKVRVAQAEVRRAGRREGDDRAVEAHLAHAEQRLDEAKVDLGSLAVESTGPGWRERLGMLPWRRVAVVAAGLFALAVVAITAFELVAGERVSSITGGTEGGGGTTITRIGGGSADDPGPEERPSDEAPASEQPSDAPTNDPSDGVSPTAQPTAEPTTEPTGSPSGSVTPVPSPTTTAPPAPPLPVEPSTAPAG